MMSKTKYTVLSYNMGSYELIHPILEKSERARYIMVTDDPDLKDESGTWDIVYDETLTGTPFDKTLQVRYNPFKYTDDTIVVKIDGSVGVNKSLDNLIDRFEKEPYDMSLMAHPGWDNFVDEYTAWVKTREYPVAHANFVLTFINNVEGYNVQNYKGLMQACYWIQRRNKLNEDANRLIYAFCKYLAGRSDEVERVDQVIASFVLQKFFGTANIMWVDQRLYQSDYFTWYPHKSNVPFGKLEAKELCKPYWKGERLHNVVRPQDL